MKTDRQELQELNQKAHQILNNKILGVNTLLKLLVYPSFHDDFRIDLIKERSGTFRIEVLKWKKVLDNQRLENPLEKIKLFGQIAPTFERESIMIGQNTSTTLLNLIENIIGNENEYVVDKKPIVLDGIHYDMTLDYNGKTIQTDWKIEPSEWKHIPLLLRLLFELTGISKDDK